jgi:hypothetical protein
VSALPQRAASAAISGETALGGWGERVVASHVSAGGSAAATPAEASAAPSTPLAHHDRIRLG